LWSILSIIQCRFWFKKYKYKYNNVLMIIVNKIMWSMQLHKYYIKFHKYIIYTTIRPSSPTGQVVNAVLSCMQGWQVDYIFLWKTDWLHETNALKQTFMSCTLIIVWDIFYCIMENSYQNANLYFRINFLKCNKRYKMQ